MKKTNPLVRILLGLSIGFLVGDCLKYIEKVIDIINKFIDQKKEEEGKVEEKLTRLNHLMEIKITAWDKNHVERIETKIKEIYKLFNNYEYSPPQIDPSIPFILSFLEPITGETTNEILY